MVYTMLMEAADSTDPSGFKESDLYRQCLAAGVLPASEEDLQRLGAAPSADMAKDQTSEGEDQTLALHSRVEGMWCPACAWVIQSALGRIKGVNEVVCDFATDRFRCRYNPIITSPEAIAQAAQRLGYRINPEDGVDKGQGLRKDFVRLILSALLSANIMMLSWALYSGFITALTPDDIRYISWPILVMATIVLLYGGGPVFRKAWGGLRAGAPGMETLISLGAASAYVYSLFNFWAGSLHLYFDTSAMLITLVLLGKLLEAKAKHQVRRDLEGFLALRPNKVRLCSQNYPQGRFVAVEQMEIGDKFRVIPDEIVPADGRVVQGTGLVDESTFTGESRPKKIHAGHRITSGSLLINGDVIVEAKGIGADSLLGQMIDIVDKSLAQRTPLESRTDRWLALFVPLLASLAVLTAVAGYLWGLSLEQAVVRGITVLVIACPCALGIAIPLARIAGIAGAGRQGILVRDFEAFERVNNVHSIVFDKTGTVTQGQWALETVEVMAGLTSREILALAAGLESKVDHAVARAVLVYGRHKGIEPADVNAVCIHADGVSGQHRGRALKLGSRSFAAGSDQADSLPQSGGTPMSWVFLSMDHKVCANLGFGDRVRSKVLHLVKHLKQSGFKLYLVSGDAHATTQAVAGMIGITDARGRMLPQDKADFITQLQAQGLRVIMVGDGINDAPALAHADLSVAVHSGTPLDRQASDVTLMRGDPIQLIDFLNLARQVNRKVQQNLWCAWGYNLVGIPIAMCGWLNPLVAATAMLLSSLTVIGNTLMLVRRR